jgi:hypothetical protein
MTLSLLVERRPLAIFIVSRVKNYSAPFGGIDLLLVVELFENLWVGFSTQFENPTPAMPDEIFMML